MSTDRTEHTERTDTVTQSPRVTCLAALAVVARWAAGSDAGACLLIAATLGLPRETVATPELAPHRLSLRGALRLAAYLERVQTVSRHGPAAFLTAAIAALREETHRARAAHYLAARAEFRHLTDAERDRCAAERLALIDDTAPVPPQPAVTDADEWELCAAWLASAELAARG